jgi:hypothetical protein
LAVESHRRRAALARIGETNQRVGQVGPVAVQFEGPGDVVAILDQDRPGTQEQGKIVCDQLSRIAVNTPENPNQLSDHDAVDEGRCLGGAARLEEECGLLGLRSIILDEIADQDVGIDTKSSAPEPFDGVFPDRLVDLLERHGLLWPREDAPELPDRNRCWLEHDPATLLDRNAQAVTRLEAQVIADPLRDCRFPLLVIVALVIGRSPNPAFPYLR